MKLRFSSRHFVVAILALLAVNAHAYDFESNGIYYNVLSEKDRTVEVTRGKDSEAYRGNITIPSRVLNFGRIYAVTSIGDEAFIDCHALTSVEFPASLTTIGEMAFYNCDALTSVEFPASLTTIGEMAFYNCHALTSVDLSSTSLTSIGDYAFAVSDALTSVKFPASLTSIGDYAFFSCAALTSVEFPVSLTTIGKGAFFYCIALTSVDLSSTSLASIRSGAFEGCNTLTSVGLPASLTSIENDVFSECTFLSKLTVDEDNPVFTSRNNVLYSKNLDTLVCYPTGLDTNVVIPDMVRFVWRSAFPRKVSAVYCQPQTPPEVIDWGPPSIFSEETLMSAVLYVPIGTKAAYMQVDDWRDFKNIEESDFSTVGINGVTAQSEPIVTVRGGKIVLEGAPTTSVIEVFSADGRCAYRGTGTVIEGLPKGAYVVRVGKFSQKLVL